MSQHTKSTARDVFSYLFMIILLVSGVIALSALAWQIINYQFPDVLQFSYVSVTEVVRNAIAGLIVVWPVFILVSWFIGRDLKAVPERAELWVRKWLMYLTLFVCAIAAVIDTVTLLNYFLRGEITTRFILKVAVVILIAAAVFGYYLWELCRNPKAKTQIPKWSAIASSVVVLTTIATGFMVIGSPTYQRAIRFDGIRVTDMQTIQNQVIVYWQNKNVLPPNLAALTDSISGYVTPTDPAGANVKYEYSAKSELSFEICSTFEKDSLPNNLGGATATSYPMYGDAANNNWNHAAGHVCFQRTIDPQIYKIVK